MKTKHTPTPWAMNAIYSNGKITHWGINGVNKTGDQLTTGRILDVPRFVPNHDGPTQEANAQFITLAVNHHEELVAALENAVVLVFHTANEERRTFVDVAQAKACWTQIHSLLTKLKG